MMDGISKLTDVMLYGILANWFRPTELREIQVTPVRGGLSGALVWRITTSQHSFCLRRWPVESSANVDDLRFVHGLQEHVYTQNFKRVPLAQRTFSHKTVLAAEGHSWELTTWMLGETVENPTDEQKAAAVEALAQFHVAAASYGEQRIAVAPGLTKRIAIIEELLQGRMADIELAVRHAPVSLEQEIAIPMLENIGYVLPLALALLRQVAENRLPLQWCLRDVHIGNFLFTGNMVSGLLDFGAATVDSVVGDLARLIRSFAGEDRLAWFRAVEWYGKNRTVNSDERRVIGAYDIGGTIGTATNWLRWRFLDKLSVADTATTQLRLRALASRLQALREGESAFSTLLGPIS